MTAPKAIKRLDGIWAKKKPVYKSIGTITRWMAIDYTLPSYYEKYSD